MDAHPDRTGGLKDPQGRVLDYLRLSITERCDLSCSYCRNEGAADATADAMTLGDIRAVGIAFARHLGFRKVRVTGGEPLLRPDLPAIVRAMREEAGFERVALTTNGRLLAAKVRELASAGLDQVNVSLDTLCEGAYREIRGADAFGAVTRGIETALEAGLRRVKVNVVLLRSFGFVEFDSFLAWGRGRPVEVRFIELMPIEGRSEFHEREHMSSEPLIERVLADGFARVGRDVPGGPEGFVGQVQAAPTGYSISSSVSPACFRRCARRPRFGD
jgi:cyclic pyranopterin phosphate synthase